MDTMIKFYANTAALINTRYTGEDRGASLVEYALLVALIAVVCIGAITILGQGASDNFDEITDEITP